MHKAFGNDPDAYAAVSSKQLRGDTDTTVIHYGQRVNGDINKLVGHLGDFIDHSLKRSNGVNQGNKSLGVVTPLQFKNTPDGLTVCRVTPDAPHSVGRIQNQAAMSESVDGCLDIRLP